MKNRKLFKSKRLVPLLALIITAIFVGGLCADVVLTSHSANAGPRIAVVKLTSDTNVDWAMEDLQERLEPFISDDPFIVDRLRYFETDDPSFIHTIDSDIVIYVTHGGKLGLLTGDDVTSWEVMADIVTDSKQRIHLFDVCSSKEIIQYGDDNSGKIVYSFTGRRAAEVSNVEITSAVLLILGYDQEFVMEYRDTELLKAKDLIERGDRTHTLDFDEMR